MGKLKLSMGFEKIIYTMSEGNPGAISFLFEIFRLEPSETISMLLFFDENEIYGSKLYMFWNDSCDRNIELVKKTIKFLEDNKITKEEIHKNLNRGRALPWIK